MQGETYKCSICQTDFELHFRYQVEERTQGSGEQAEVVRSYYCSQRCLEKSYLERAEGGATCDACATRFQVELASQVLFTGGKRHYACSTLCRQRILAGARAVRVGQLADPAFQPGDDGDSAPVPTARSEASPTPPPASVVSVREPRAAAPAPKVVAVFNHKGGTGKTTTSVHLAAGLALEGHRVLLIDTDGQGNVAASLGLKAERTLYHVVVMNLDFRTAVVNARPNLDCVLSNETLAAAELFIAGQRQRDRILADRFAGVRDAYDYVVVDCSPSLSLMNQNALVLSDAVLCPVACDFLSLYGVRQVLRTIKQVNRLLSHPVRLWGVLPTMFDSRARICRESLHTLREHFGDACLDPVHYAVRAKEAPAQGKTLFEHEPGSLPALDYKNLVGRLLGKQAQGEFQQAAGGDT
jgi:chromosome partitioning protein